jgi:hypothetical protein
LCAGFTDFFAGFFAAGFFVARAFALTLVTRVFDLTAMMAPFYLDGNHNQE